MTGFGVRVAEDAGKFFTGMNAWGFTGREGWPIVTPEIERKIQLAMRQPGENRAMHRARMKKERRQS